MHTEGGPRALYHRRILQLDLSGTSRTRRGPRGVPVESRREWWWTFIGRHPRHYLGRVPMSRSGEGHLGGGRREPKPELGPSPRPVVFPYPCHVLGSPKGTGAGTEEWCGLVLRAVVDPSGNRSRRRLPSSDDTRLREKSVNPLLSVE